MGWLQDLAKPYLWVRRFKCKCGKVHEVKSRRSQLNKLQAQREAECINK